MELSEDTPAADEQQLISRSAATLAGNGTNSIEPRNKRDRSSADLVTFATAAYIREGQAAPIRRCRWSLASTSAMMRS